MNNFIKITGNNSSSIIVNGVPFTPDQGSDEFVLTIGSKTHHFCGDISIQISGGCGNVSATSGNISITGDSGDASTISGDIKCKNIHGDVSTISGDVNCIGNISGNVSTISGDISR